MRFFTQKFKKSKVLSAFLFCGAMLFALNGFSQKSVQGTIFEQGTESPIIGANVLVKGSSTGTVTDYKANSPFLLSKGRMCLFFLT